MFILPHTLKNEAIEHRRRLLATAVEAGLAADDIEALPLEVTQAFVFSDFISQQCRRHSHLLPELWQSGDLQRAYEPAGYRRRLTQLWRHHLGTDPPCAERPAADREPPVSKTDLQRVLRLFRRREMVRIAIRDICGWADLAHTLEDLSALADACLETALAQLNQCQVKDWGCPRAADGAPQHLVVLALGKLGAHELNFSSDVDLMFAYPRDGSTEGGSRGGLTNDAFFLRLARDLIQVIGAPTADGFVFRVDTRLRPFGEAGPLVLSYDKLEDYYHEQGREWERYALIKARVAAGDRVSGARLLQRLRSFIYRRYLDYGAFDSLRDMKTRINLEVHTKNLEDNVKLGSGGIREIEFFGQMFQLIRGGVEPALQIRPIQKVLASLVQKRYIAASVAQTLDTAYVFLRTVENRVQQWADQQIHHLPKEPEARFRLAAAMGFETWEQFKKELDRHRRLVHAHFDGLLSPKAGAGDSCNGKPRLETLKRLGGFWQGMATDGQSQALLQQLGYKNSATVIRLVTALREDRSLKALSLIGRQRLDKLMPMLLEAVARAREPELVLDRVIDLLKSIQRRTSYLALLIENPAALTHLVHLSEASPWIAAYLSRHPVLLDELLDPRTLYRPPQKEDLGEELNRRLSDIDPEDLDYQMEVLRVFKQVNVFRVAASDVTDVLPLMKVSDHLSDIAEILLEEVVARCWRRLSAKYGIPCCELDGHHYERGFAVLAYGKLGGLELGYASDLDLVFLHAAAPGETSGGPRGMDNALFFSRLGQRVLHMLTTHTPAGTLYEADMRLRPSGTSGMLVSHIDGFAQYQHKDAWTWEHQALIRARAITGDPLFRRRFESLRHDILTQTRDPNVLKKEVAGMREKLRAAAPKVDPGLFDIKQGAGGIVDIEFLVQYLVLRHARNNPEIIRWTDNVRLLQSLNEAGVLDDTTAFGLRRAYLVYRAMVHRLSLRQHRGLIDDDRFDAARQFVIKTWNRFLKPFV